MPSLKTLALAATAVAGLGLFAASQAEARPFGHRHGGFHGHRHFGHGHGGFHGHRHFHRHGHWRGGPWLGLGLVGGAVMASDCYRVRWVDTPYGLVRRTVNVCGY